MLEAALACAREGMLHGLIAAAVVLTLLRCWRLERPQTRLRLALLALAFPVVVQPLLFALVPERHGVAFAQDQALFALDSYAPLGAPGVPADRAIVLGLAALALLLLARDLVPFLSERFERAPARLRDPTLESRLDASVSRLSAGLGLEPPRLRLIDEEHPDIFCTGLWRRELVVSAGVVRTLDGDELDAAVAHELAHARSHDPFLGWLLMAVRAAFFFNPAVQLLARWAARELESRADAVAAGQLERPVTLARTLVKTFRHGLGHRRFGRWLDPWRLRALVRRCRGLLATQPPRGLPAEALHLVLTGLGLASLLFFVV